MKNELEIINLSDLEKKGTVPGSKVSIVHSQNMTIAYWNFDKGISLPEHNHPHEQVVNIISGVFELTVDGEPYQLNAGQTVIVPPHAQHSGKAITDSYVIDVFYPIREDYR